MTEPSDVPPAAARRPAPALTVVLPTRNERDNVAPLLAALVPALDGILAELVVVDDSTDGTAEEFARHADSLPFPLRLVVRPPADRRRGLAADVVRGFGAALGDYVCVMDADLQHPPALARELLETAQQERADVVIASRYVAGGSAGGLANGLRHAASQSSNLVTRLLFPRRVWPVRDPMSGCFVARRAVLRRGRLRPVGYKILLEVLVRCRPRHVRELPYQMDSRHAGHSKANLRQAWNFLRHLARLRLST